MSTSPSTEPVPLEEDPDWAALDADAARQIAATLPLSTRFSLGVTVTPVQQAFLDHWGFVVFARVAAPEEVQRILEEADGIEARLLAENRRKVNGLPVWVGRNAAGEPFIQRLAFTTLFSPYIHAFVRDPRFEPIRQLIGEHARVGDSEKDGVVLNRYVRVKGSLRSGLGWHTDGLRDLFYGRMPQRMLNVGLHFDRIRPEDGGLRIIPRSHEQGLFSTVFRKPYFVSNRPDPDEVAVETWPGDLTVHDGRTWHRVQPSPYSGARSLRRSMYVPYLTHAYEPKSEESKTPLYMRVFDVAMRARKRLGR